MSSMKLIARKRSKEGNSEGEEVGRYRRKKGRNDESKLSKILFSREGRLKRKGRCRENEKK